MYPALLREMGTIDFTIHSESEENLFKENPRPGKVIRSLTNPS